MDAFLATKAAGPAGSRAQPSPQDMVSRILGPNGAAVRSGCSYRPAQERASRFVLDALQSGQGGCLEGGTGLGKSYAYLTAAADLVRQGHKVVVSTATINLQQQLIDHDIPAIQKLTGTNLNAVLVKGRSNYVSLRRAHRAASRNGKLPPKDRAAAEHIRDQAMRGMGDKGMYSSSPPESVWQAVSSDRHDCLGKQCGFFQQCHFYNARRRQREAGLMITNHALLCVDLKLSDDGAAGVLPEYDYVIVDEAHELPGIATTMFGERISLQQIRYLFRSFRVNAAGCMPKRLAEEVESQLVAAEKILEITFRTLHKSAKDGLTKSVHVPLADMLHETGTKLAEAARAVTDLGNRAEVTMASMRFIEIAKAAKLWATVEDGYVSYAEHTQKNISLIRSPIEVAGHFQRLLYSKAPVVMASATLGINGSMDHFQSQAGIGGLSLTAPSPFDYRKAVKLNIPKTMPLPDDPAYSGALGRHIKQAINKTSGGCLVLFTSYRQMNQTRSDVEAWVKTQGLTLMCQGSEHSRDAIVEAMRANPNCVVFGTDSFWQGVDIPGRNLRQVIITKLPFTVPDGPVIKRRFEMLQKKGKNPFFHYSLPEAILKVKQGFGRLIRSETDTGEVTILDRRILEKGYGREFLAALPECSR